MNHIIKIVALIGSVRPDNNTAKVVANAAAELESLDDVEVEVIDPAEMQLKLPGQGTTDDARKMQEVVASADAVILATPEYHGSYSSTIKLMIDNLGFPSKLKDKPVALLGAASGRIGAIKALEHLRSVASHVGAIVLPGPVSVAAVHKAFDDDGRLLDEGTTQFLRQLMDGLVTYTRTHKCTIQPMENLVRSNV